MYTYIYIHITYRRRSLGDRTPNSASAGDDSIRRLRRGLPVSALPVIVGEPTCSKTFPPLKSLQCAAGGQCHPTERSGESEYTSTNTNSLFEA